MVVQREILQVDLQQHQRAAQSEMPVRRGAARGQPALLRAQNHTGRVQRVLLRHVHQQGSIHITNC